MNTGGYFEIPDDFTPSPRGSSPELLTSLFSHLKGASEIKISFFLYNNPYFHEFIEEEISSNGGKTIIYTTPLDGYDKRRSLHVTSNGREKRLSKWDYAQKIFARILKSKDSNIEIRFFPHTNLWSAQKTSRGHDSYALHNKSILVQYPDGTSKCISSSSNFALGDPRHSENFFVTDQDPDVRMFNAYFRLLHEHSISMEEYRFFRKTKKDFEYTTQPTNMLDEFLSCYFTAPFIKYNNIGSNHYVQQRIIKFIRSAQNRLYFCFQHFSDIDSFDKRSRSIVNELCGIAANNSSLDIKILKQTRPCHQAQGRKTQKTEECLAKFDNIAQKYWFPIIHDKFIIADNNLMVTTANLTSTQFAWSEHHNMMYRDGGIKRPVRNTFSDVNSFHFIYGDSVTSDYQNHFDTLWKRANLL